MALIPPKKPVWHAHVRGTRPVVDRPVSDSQRRTRRCLQRGFFLVYLSTSIHFRREILKISRPKDLNIRLSVIREKLLQNTFGLYVCHSWSKIFVNAVSKPCLKCICWRKVFYDDFVVLSLGRGSLLDPLGDVSACKVRSVTRHHCVRKGATLSGHESSVREGTARPRIPMDMEVCNTTQTGTVNSIHIFGVGSRASTTLLVDGALT